VRGWDLAASVRKLIKSDPDYTATCLVGWSPSQRRWIIAHAEHWRESPGDVRKIMKRIAEEDRERFGDVRIEIPQDPGQAGHDQAQSILVDMAAFSIRASTVSGDKVARADPVAGQAQIGNIDVLIGPWNDDFMAELCGFPTGSHDDYVDALSTAFNRLTGGRKGIIDFYAQQVLDRMKEDGDRGQIRDGEIVYEETDDLGRAYRLSGD